MDPRNLYKPVRLLSFVVLLLLVAAAAYAFVMAGLLWTGINV